MRDITSLDRQLLNSEYEAAKTLYGRAREQGHSAIKSAAMCYRAGRLDGQESQKARTQEAYKKLHAIQTPATEPPALEAETTLEEDNDNVGAEQ